MNRIKPIFVFLLMLMFFISSVSYAGSYAAQPDANSVVSEKANSQKVSREYKDSRKESPYKTEVAVFTAPDVISGVIAAFEWVISKIGDFLVNVLFKSIADFFTGLLDAFLGFLGSETDREIRADISAEKGLQQEKMTQDAFHDWRHDQRLDIQMNVEHKRQLDRDKAIIRYEAESFIYSGAAGAICERQSSRYYAFGAFGNAQVGRATDAVALNRERYNSRIQRNQARTGEVLVDLGEGAINGALDETLNSPARDAYVEAVNEQRAPGEPAYEPSPCDANDAVNYNETFDRNPSRTLQEDPECPGTQNTPTEQAAKSRQFVDNVFNNETLTPLETNDIERAYDEDTGYVGSDEIRRNILDRRQLTAFRSIAKNTFSAIENRKNPYVSTDDQPTILDQAQEIAGTDGSAFENTPWGEKVKQYQSQPGPNGTTLKPSYEAQLEFLAKIIHMNPANLTGLDERFENQLLFTNAMESVVMYDTLKSQWRKEALLAAMLEIVMTERQEKVEAQARRIVNRN